MLKEVAYVLFGTEQTPWEQDLVLLYELLLRGHPDVNHIIYQETLPSLDSPCTMNYMGQCTIIPQNQSLLYSTSYVHFQVSLHTSVFCIQIFEFVYKVISQKVQEAAANLPFSIQVPVLYTFEAFCS